MAKRVLVINGPNLNMLGIREKEIYGGSSLEMIQEDMIELAQHSGMEVEFFQSNHEGELVDRIQEAYRQEIQLLIVNAGALTHYSIALHDALKAVALPVIEVHMSNIFKREPFRHQSLISPVSVGGIFGFGALSYRLAIVAAAEILLECENDPAES
ncbi:MAG TPA: type II 3-dehydroquinate dehydratase [Syntrophomonadaceae bacterium]|nr:type II 3-dehydroquinate dehydratase [Syntrophomonadaceae bacterium]